MKRIAVESPYAGDIQANISFAKNVCRYITLSGDSPYAMHLLFPQFLDEEKPDERKLGIACGLVWVRQADEVWFCLADHPQLSGGMRIALDDLRELPDAPLLRFFRFTQVGAVIAEFDSPEFTNKL